ncbi:MAG: VOC family protein, partial [Bacteroidota bacterium]
IVMNLNQVTLPAKDLAPCIHFYQLLGHRLIVDATPHYARFECPTGDSTFSLHQVQDLVPNTGVAIYFECEDLDEQVAALLAKGVSFELLPTNQSWRWREARLRDPAGNLIVLFFAGADRKRPPWRIN